MAQAPTDVGSHAGLQEKILQELRGAGRSLEASELAWRCKVPKKTLNQTLYRMQRESKVFHKGQAKWALTQQGSGPGGQAEKATSSQGRGADAETLDSRPRGSSVGDMLGSPGPPAADPAPHEAAVPELSHHPPRGLSDLEVRICQFLAAGPQRALRIAQFLDYGRAKDVNPTLYRMKDRGLVHKDPQSHVWSLNQPEGFGGGSERGPIIIQDRPVNVYIQNPKNFLLGDSSYIVSDISALQIGDSCHLTMGAEALRRQDTGHIVTDSEQMPQFSPPGSQPGEGTTQEGPGTLCLLEDTPAGHGSGMVDSPGPAGPGAGRKESRKPESDAGPAPLATQPADEPPCGQESIRLSAQLAAVRLESQDRSPPGTAPDGQEGGSL